MGYNSVDAMQRCFEFILICLRNLKLTNDAEQFFIFLMACVRRQLKCQDLFLGSLLDPSSPWLYFDVLREADCLPVELGVGIVVAEELC